MGTTRQEENDYADVVILSMMRDMVLPVSSSKVHADIKNPYAGTDDIEYCERVNVMRVFSVTGGKDIE